MIIYDECQTKIGHLRYIFNEDGALERIVLTDDLWHALTAKQTMKRNHELGKPVCQQFKEYVHGDRSQFDLSYELLGTPFQKQTWQALRNIPYGGIRTYSEIANSIGRPKAIRAVGQANAGNPLPILFPCHRVIGSNKKLTGYAGGMDMKKQLLEIEGAEIS
ncbi:methylated-DNA--[protein]-cysteine S-methyltransferase [Tenuibacillus multivorans]|uniref:methylated-DNA--[protein]-cysteine S-methyltransferase n=1 Tax=Tenuibacillus multivorans TaxID=237069 RepID=A0A1H0BPW9_9BACI|nr:methylated-DNA--[protein]-cysteine S-methyltransferase [Tenuibacillus multivorans]GEL77079.1 methylated-DNA--protein-cysteine methyltransferase, constitutive [Tenuibacillus multivorans]SDN47696.1 O-6-methylguanine DNA methyltransferase [Tenuibacillus multivorans]